MDSNLNRRYLNYCRAHGRTAEEQANHDYRRWPGGVNTGFMLWIGEQKLEFWRAHPEAFFDPSKPQHIIDQEAWDRWLDETDGRLSVEGGS